MTDAAIVGLGLTPMSTKPGAPPEFLAAQAVAAALADASMEQVEVDGLLVNSSQGVRPDRLGVALARHVGFGPLRLLEHVEIKGATAVAMVQRAVLAVRAGLARSVVCVFADAPICPGGTSGSTYARSGGVEGMRGLERASGLLGSVPTFALLASRYLSVSEGDEDDLCAVACSARQWARHNPDAISRTTLSPEQYRASPMVSTPLRLLDCARPVNGAGAIIVSTDDRRSDVEHPMVYVRGMAQWHPMRRRVAPGESWFGGGAGEAVAAALAMAGRTRADVDALELYDPFSVVTLCLLEEYGFCPPGTAGLAFRSGECDPGGSLPTNTGGGQLSAFYLQGITPLAEGIIQVRGAGGQRQVPAAATALVAGIGGRIDHHACLVLDREPA
jgi:acetyl-CoA acetyltransferase